MLSVVLPAYNESETLENTVKEIVDFLESRNEIFELIVVENGSTDNTAEIGEKLEEKIDELRFFQQPDADYGAALRKGFLESNGDIVINFDVDFYDFDFLERAVTKIRDSETNRPAIIVGSKRNIDSVDERPFVRRFATSVFSVILKVLFNLKVSDTHGIKALHRSSVAPIIDRCIFTKDLFDSELIIKSEKAGLNVTEIAVDVRESRPARSKLISRIPRTLKGLLKLRFHLLKQTIFRRNGL